jgi:hypothetical protein
LASGVAVAAEGLILNKTLTKVEWKCHGERTVPIWSVGSDGWRRPYSSATVPEEKAVPESEDASHYHNIIKNDEKAKGSMVIRVCIEI